jgi:hypothetical protein
LKGSNQKANESALEYRRNMEEMKDFADEDEIIEEKNEWNLAEVEKQDSDELNENELKEVEQAKKYREKRRVLNSGDYISLKKDNEDFDDIMTTREKDRIKTNVMRNMQQGNARPAPDEELSPEEDDEVNKWENQILKSAINSSKENFLITYN